MKIAIVRIVLILLLCGTFFIIFNFSSQDATESGSISKKVTQIITKNIKSIQKLEKAQKEEIIKKVEKIIRKIAHFSIYTLVGFLLMGLLSTYKLNMKQKVSISLIIGIIYAITDEFHQSFVPGRSPQITDVGIDSLGVLFGILMLILCLKIVSKVKTMYKNSINLKHNNKIA